MLLQCLVPETLDSPSQLIKDITGVCAYMCVCVRVCVVCVSVYVNVHCICTCTFTFVMYMYMHLSERIFYLSDLWT